MSIKSEKVKQWRRSTKRRIIESMGGTCVCCGYDRCHRSLVLHHINPSEKEISFGSIIASPINWDSIVIELKKCVLLCSNCHGEIHAGILDLPETYHTFDNKYLEYKTKKVITKVSGKAPLLQSGDESEQN